VIRFKINRREFQSDTRGGLAPGGLPKGGAVSDSFRARANDDRRDLARSIRTR